MEIKELIKKLLSIAMLIFSALSLIESAVEVFSSLEKIAQLILNAIVIYLLVSNKLSIDIKRNRLTNSLLAVTGIGILVTPIVLIYANSFDIKDLVTSIGSAFVLVCYTLFYKMFCKIFSSLKNSPIKSFSDYTSTYIVGLVMWCLSIVAVFTVLMVYSTEAYKSEWATIWVFSISIIAQLLYLGVLIAKHKGQNYIWATSIIYLIVTIPMFLLSLFIIMLAIIAVVVVLVFRILFHTATSTNGGSVDMNSAGCCANCGNWRGGICANNRNVLNPNQETCAQYYRG